MKVDLEERPTAGKRISVETLLNGRWVPWYKRPDDTRRGGLEEMIQGMADDGYNFAGMVDEFVPTGTVATYTQDFLFIKAAP